MRALRFLSVLALVFSASLLGSSGTAVAANPLLCFSGTTDGGFNGTCTLTASGAILNTFDGDTNPNNNYAGVYYAQSTLSGGPLAAASIISFSYAAGAATNASGGSPRVSIPIDDMDATTSDTHAFVDTLGCNDGSANNGTLSLSNPNCTVAFSTGGSWVNWAAFAAAHPTWKIDTGVPFVIADQPGLWTITNVHLGENVANVASDKEKCKQGGWADMTRADGTSFKNQGDCIQYVNTGK